MPPRRGNTKQRSFLNANHRDKGYNETLSHVYETAVASLDKNSSKGGRKKRVPNIFKMCFKSASKQEDEMRDLSAAAYSSRSGTGSLNSINVQNNDPSENEALFLNQNGEVESGQQQSSSSLRGTFKEKFRGGFSRITRNSRRSQVESIY